MFKRADGREITVLVEKLDLIGSETILIPIQRCGGTSEQWSDWFVIKG